jgi:LPS export ABC transporter protein LptC/lipopolysaccharide transport protein LptA
MARKAKSSVAGLRKLMLAVLAVLLLGVGGLFWFGKAGQRREKPPAMDPKSAQVEKGLSLIGEDFDYTFTEREKPIFRIRGTSVKADRQGIIYLDNVAVTLYDKQGRVFHVESKNASFNRESNEGQLQGEVFLKGPDELELRTDHLDLQDKGNTVSSPSAVEIRYLGKYIANAGRMELDLGGQVYTLMGGSQVRSIAGIEPALRLNAQRFVFERTKHWIRCEGGASLHRGEDWLEAERLYGNVAEDESGLTFVHAIWNVNGETRSALQTPSAKTAKAATRTKVKFSGRELSVVLQPQGNQPRSVALESPLDGRASLESTSPGLVRTLTAKRHIEGTLENGVLNSAQAFGSVEIVENAHLPGKPPTQRQASGQTASAAFRPDGQLATVELSSNVVYRDGDVTATGNHGNLDMEQGRGEFVGAPVVVSSDRGRMEAPRMQYNTDTQIVSARDGVKAKLQKVEETALAGSPLAQGEGPVNVISQEAFWRQQPSSFVFRGDVRAWRGDNVLLAPEIRGDKAADQLAASGGVKTIWYPTDQQASQAAGKSAQATTPAPTPVPKAAATPAAPRQPVQVVANEMTYGQKTGVLIYTGNVRVDQQGKTLSCQKMQVDLDDKRQAKTMVCTGDTKINDPQAGRTILGQRAVYHVADKQVEVFGDPVTMKDKDGNQIHGKRAVYAMDTGKVEVKGQDPNAPATPAAATAVTPATAAATPAPAVHPPGSGG